MSVGRTSHVLMHLTNYWHELPFESLESFEEPLLHVERYLVVVEVVDAPLLKLFVVLEIRWVQVILIVLMEFEDLTLLFAQFGLIQRKHFSFKLLGNSFVDQFEIFEALTML